MDISVLKELRNIKLDLSNGKISTSGELALRLSKIAEVGDTNIRIPRIAPSEPPNSAKYNKTVSTIENQLTNNEYIFDILLAAAIYDYDTAQALLDDLYNRVMGLTDSAQTLFFYSQPSRSNVHIIGTNFCTGWGVFNGNDTSLTRDNGCGLMLPILKKEAGIGKGFLTGDGIPGNYYLLNDDGTLKATTNAYDKSRSLADSDPTTHYEHERFYISDSALADTKGYGFGFSDTDLKWASSSYQNVSMEIVHAFNPPIDCNYVTISPAVSSDEYVIDSIILYLGGDSVATLEPQGLIINQELLMHGQDGYSNEGAFLFDPCLVDRVQVLLHSSKAVPCKVAHYWKKDEDGEIIPGESPSFRSPHSLIDSVILGDTSRGVEELPAERYSIGIKDFFVQKITFGTEGVITSEPVKFHKPIDRVALKATHSTPEGTTLKFSLTFNNGKNWYDIYPLGESLTQQIIAVNDMIPSAYQDPSTYYITTDGQPTECMVKIALSREKGKNANRSPLLKKFELEVMLKA